MTPVLAPAFSLMLLLLAGAPLDLPLSLPPLPEDARLANVAPEKCLWYVALSGVAPVDSKSKNCVEQLLAEDDVKRFVREVSTKLKDAFAKASPNDPVRKLLGEESPKLLELLLTKPLCAYLEAVGPGPQGPTLRGGLVVTLDAQAADIQASLEKLESTLLGLAKQQANVSADGWHTLPLPKDAPQVQWGVQEKYLIIGIGENEAGAALGRLKNSKTAPQWLATARKDLAIQRPSVVQYLNLEALLKMLDQPMTAMHGPERSRKILEVLGAKNLQYYASVAGLDGDEYVSKTTLSTDGKPIGILSLLTGPPLAAETFDSIPADATFAVAKRVDTDKGIELLLQIVDALQPPGAPNPLTQAIDRFAATTGVNIKTDIVAALGNSWCAYNSPSDGGLIFTGLTITASIRDREKLLAANDKFLRFTKQLRERSEQLRANGVQRVPNFDVGELNFRDQKIFFTNFIGDPSPFAPAWCITDKQVVFALFPQSIKAFLERQANSPAAKGATALSPPQRLSSLPLVAKQLKSKDGPVVLAYQNTPALFELAYPFAQISAQFACAELQREGIDLNIGMLPNARAIAPHLIPTTTSVRGTERGIQIESHGSLPMGFGPLAMLTVPFAIRSSVIRPPADDPFGDAPPTQLGVFPNIDLAPGFAERTASINNLKQIAVAIINFVDMKKTLPAGAILSKDGKPLLSWRVAILPFLEQNQLFAQFKLDEPWDSEHNKALIEKMPDVLKAPGSKATSEFKTVYLAVRGDNTAMPLDKPVKIRSITDGMSATIAVVEVADDKAVIWTKPDDFEPDEKNPIAGLVGLRDGVFLAAFCDAHVQEIPANVDLESLKALFTRNGGEIVDLQNLKRQAPAGAK
jgi:hypothetical protein